MGRNFPQLRSTLSAWFAIGKLGFERLCPKPDQSRHVDPELEWRLHTRSTPLVFPLTIFRQQTPETSATRGRSERFSISEFSTAVRVAVPRWDRPTAH